MTMGKIQEVEKQYSQQLDQLRKEIQQVVSKVDIKSQAAIDKLLSSNELDEKLARMVMLTEATPHALAEFVAKDEKNIALVQPLFDDTDLLKEILLADSPTTVKGGFCEYGPAMKIYHEIQQVSKHVKSGSILKQLALAVALEHAVQVPQENPEKPAPPYKGEAYVDPVRRYLHYEKAYLEGHLDPAFDQLSTWDLRMVVDGPEPDQTLEWGRTMMLNYYPDHILNNNYGARYVAMVNTNIRYGSQDVKHDRPELQRYQNILMNGGVCGRRAFFGRFVLRAFGIPTTARPSKGHGALCHWTPDGWVVNLGPAWGAGWTKTRYHKDLDFLATTKARTTEAYWKVKRAQWIGDAFSEERVYGEHDEAGKRKLGLWYGVSLLVQNEIIEGMSGQKAQLRAPKGQVEPTLAEKMAGMVVSQNAKTIQYDSPAKGTITIPAAAYLNARQVKDVQVMKSFPDGLQIYLPPFKPQGITIMRGGTWKMDPAGCCSGARLKSGGYGKYEDWGFRVALSAGEASEDSCPSETLSIDLDVDGKVRMEMVYIKPGSFIMGGEHEKDGRFECVEVPKHKVTLTKGFYLGKYPVTQAQYQVIMGGNPSKSTKAPDCPVDNIGENDAFEYCDKLVEIIGKDFRLPTEAEWEYAARGGKSDTKWFFGNDPSQLGEYAWFKGNSGGKSHPVGQKRPNPFGLYDMYGNVFERIADKYDKDYYRKSPEVDPLGPQQGTKSTFEYKVNVPLAGKYSLVARVVTANPDQRLNIRVNGNESTDQILKMPCANGYWQDTDAITISFKDGENVLRFWRDNPPQYGVSIKAFTLKPLN